MSAPQPPLPPPKKYNGWRVVLWGSVAFVAGLIATAFLWITRLDLGTKAPFVAVGLVVGGLIFMGIGLLHVITGKPVTDDSNVHGAFRARQRQALLQQRKERRRERKTKGA